MSAYVGSSKNLKDLKESFAADSFASELSDSQARNLAGSFEAAGRTHVGGFGARENLRDHLMKVPGEALS